MPSSKTRNAVATWLFGGRGSPWHAGGWKYVLGGALVLGLVLAIACGSPPPSITGPAG